MARTKYVDRDAPEETDTPPNMHYPIHYNSNTDDTTTASSPQAQISHASAQPGVRSSVTSREPGVPYWTVKQQRAVQVLTRPPVIHGQIPRQQGHGQSFNRSINAGQYSTSGQAEKQRQLAQLPKPSIQPSERPSIAPNLLNAHNQVQPQHGGMDLPTALHEINELRRREKYNADVRAAEKATAEALHPRKPRSKPYKDFLPPNSYNTDNGIAGSRNALRPDAISKKSLPQLQTSRNATVARESASPVFPINPPTTEERDNHVLDPVEGLSGDSPTPYSFGSDEELPMPGPFAVYNEDRPFLYKAKHPRNERTVDMARQRFYGRYQDD
ncbi:hypothetical protein P280DRAFT_515385 [Massarina eburnea CBS 473.64]|uniref:Uncharacterized protein n=1 Tax=Massarina eburnea CBS 473.64 TaxID=1395130 RepID=A0A6A6S7G6_9PLEO|nr:hypothetical protein P280DRAFT_515385 [Massarina eburnea CBS 473.64]